MGKTIAEKIIGEHAAKEVKAGELVVAEIDLAYAQDWTGPLAISQIKQMGFTKLKDPNRVVFFIDHSSPSSVKETATDHINIRSFCKETGAKLYDVGEGVCHQIVAESLASPGMLIVGADSHTCMGGAFSAFATGMGSTDVAVAMALGKTWLRVPESIKVIVKGKLREGVYGKDIILHLIGLITADGATYKSLEFHGEAIEALPFTERLAICNMAIEAGAKCGLIPSDEKTKAYLGEHKRGHLFRAINADEDALYEKVIEIDGDQLEPTVSMPHTVDNTRPISHPDCQGVKLNQVYIGSCTNGRIEDYRIAAKIIQGKKVHPGVRLVITPASKEVYINLLREGLMETFLEAGAVINSPGCGACPGAQTGILGDGERCLASNNRNFKGRMGNPKAEVYLASPATCAASAIEGKIADPRKYL